MNPCCFIIATQFVDLSEQLRKTNTTPATKHKRQMPKHPAANSEMHTICQSKFIKPKRSRKINQQEETQKCQKCPEMKGFKYIKMAIINTPPCYRDTRELKKKTYFQGWEVQSWERNNRVGRTMDS